MFFYKAGSQAFLPSCFVQKLGATYVLRIRLTHIGFHLPKIGTMKNTLKIHIKTENLHCSLSDNVELDQESECLKWILPGMIQKTSLNFR